MSRDCLERIQLSHRLHGSRPDEGWAMGMRTLSAVEFAAATLLAADLYQHPASGKRHACCIQVHQATSAAAWLCSKEKQRRHSPVFVCRAGICGGVWGADRCLTQACPEFCGTAAPTGGGAHVALHEPQGGRTHNQAL